MAHKIPPVIARQSAANHHTILQTPRLADSYVLRPNVTADGVAFQPRVTDSLDATPGGQDRANKLGRFVLSSFPWFFLLCLVTLSGCYSPPTLNSAYPTGQGICISNLTVTLPQGTLKADWIRVYERQSVTNSQ